MHATIYLRDGSRLDVLDARTVKVEYHRETSGFALRLVCRDDAGQVVADFERAEVLAYRQPKMQSQRQSAHLSDQSSVACSGADIAAE